MAFCIARFPSFGAIGLLSRGIDTYCENVYSHYYHKDNACFYEFCPSNTTYGEIDKLIWERALEEKIWLFGGVGQIIHFVNDASNAMNISPECIIEQMNQHTLVLILTDSPILKRLRYYITNLKKIKFHTIFSMIDLFHYGSKLPVENIFPYHQPVEMIRQYRYLLSLEKSKDLKIIHAPNEKIKANQKGTEEIKKAFECFPTVDFSILPPGHRIKILERKREANVYIDQLIYNNPNCLPPNHYTGGLGKSGLEAIMLDTAVVTSGDLQMLERARPDLIPTPPVLWTDYHNFQKDIQILFDEDMRENQIAKQREWGQKYLTLKFVSEYMWAMLGV